MKTVAFLVLSMVFGACFSDDNLQGSSCGQHQCSIYYYCDKQTYQCEECKNICSQSHNFDQQKCLSECKIYFFDERYEPLINNLKIKFNVAIALIVILIIGFIALLVMILKQQKKFDFKNIRAVFKRQNATKSNGVSNNAQGDHMDKKVDLKIDIPDSTVQSESPTTVTTGVSRIPAEDSIVYAYDNPAMSNSPKTISAVSPS